MGMKCSLSINPEAFEMNPNELQPWDDEFMRNHCHFGQDCLQIVNCDDPNCCLSWRRFLPFPIPVTQTSTGLKALERTYTDSDNFKFLGLFQRQAIQVEDILLDSCKGFANPPFDL